MLPSEAAQVHAAEVTEALRVEEPPYNLRGVEAICSRCAMAFVVSDRTYSWGMCSDCCADLVPVGL